MDAFIDNCIKRLENRLVKSGGFSSRENTGYRPDATAWAITALNVVGFDEHILRRARSRLASSQLQDGRIVIAPKYPDSYWPTALGVFSWLNSPEHDENRMKAVNFLLNSSGVHWQKSMIPKVVGHDTSIRGWSWTERTHSWVEPTSLCILALRLTGFEKHERVQEGIEMLIDRQLKNGGWNYGNTYVFGNELNPMPDCTGIALSAIAGLFTDEEIKNSLIYMEDRLKTVRSPLSLSWGIIGLAAWEKRPSLAKEWLSECWDLQDRYGLYDTSMLSLLLLAYSASKGLLDLLNIIDKI